MIAQLLPLALYAGTATGSVLARRPCSPGLVGVLNKLAVGRGQAVLERERRFTLELVFQQLPAGMCIIGCDPAGQEWLIGPAVIAQSGGSKETTGEQPS